jgi:hypothetical protein
LNADLLKLPEGTKQIRIIVERYRRHLSPVGISIVSSLAGYVIARLLGVSNDAAFAGAAAIFAAVIIVAYRLIDESR